MTVHEIQGYLAELYATYVSPDLISRVTEARHARLTLDEPYLEAPSLSQRSMSCSKLPR